MIHITECPRDAMQGIEAFIPTATKTAYMNALLQVGFDRLDFGSFVSPRAIPQLADTAEVLGGLDLSGTGTDLLTIVANMRGANDALAHPEIAFLGYPFSISETFQVRNTRKTIAQSLELVEEMQAACVAADRTLLVYLSMGFGNPYGDPWSPEIAAEWTEKLVALGIRHIALADTVGSAGPDTIGPLFHTLLATYPEVEFGAHFHAAPQDRAGKIQAAWDAGCRRFDVAMKGFGGCPFAEDELVGNIATESLLAWAADQGIETELQADALGQAMTLADGVFH
ncbi:MAG: hydroxymethylglutaryl-CoA lyase [Bacteroidota bacterium]